MLMAYGVRTDQRHFADVLFRGGPVYTVDPNDRVVEACATRYDRIIGCGKLADLLHLVGPDTRIVDLEGKCLVPGLVDAHSHIVGQGLAMEAIDCKHDLPALDDLLARVAAAARSAPAGTWLLGRGYNQNKLGERRHPERRDLDRAAPDHPVALTRTCGHIMACNSRALDLAGISALTPDPPGGTILRDADGEPTGVLLESACRPVQELITPTVTGYRRAYQAACREYLSLGITSAHDASGSDPSQVRAMVQGHDQDQVKLRTYMMLRLASSGPAAGNAALQSGMVSGLGGPGLRVGPLKIMLDGSSSGPTAATREPYASRPGYSGILYHDQHELNSLVKQGIDAGFQMTAHCVGDRAIAMMLRAITENSDGRGDGRRHRIEHCAMLDEQLIAAIRSLGVVPVANPSFLWEFGDGYVADYGMDRARWMFPLRSLLGAGVPAAAGSDAPVTYVDPFLGLYCAMTRKTATGAEVGPEQAVSFAQALRSYTYNGAWASGEEHIKGSVERGKLADLAVVSLDLGSASPEQIRNAAVVMTMLGGEIVYER